MELLVVAKALLLLLLLGAVPAAFVEARFFSPAIARDRLVRDLLVNYDPNVRPAKTGEKIMLHVNIVLQHFNFHESDGAFKFIGLLDVHWRDPKLKWNPQDYNNLTKIAISQKAIWVPDLEIYNNAPDKFLRMHSNGVLLLQNNGNLIWSDVIDVSMFCTTNMQNWPKDSHFCKMSLGSWTYDGYDVDITNSKINESVIFDSIATKSSEYRITNFTAEHVSTIYPCCTQPYVTIDYSIYFERRSSVVVIRMPAFCIMLLTLLALCMDPVRSEKLWLNGISLIVIVLNLIYFANNIGRFARSTPSIVLFYSCSLVLVTLTQLLSVFSLLATRSRLGSRVPAIVARFLKNSFSQFLAPMHPQRTKPVREDSSPQYEEGCAQDMSTLIRSDTTPNEWAQLAKLLQRVSLIAFSFIFLILGTHCLSFNK